MDTKMTQLGGEAANKNANAFSRIDPEVVNEVTEKTENQSIKRHGFCISMSAMLFLILLLVACSKQQTPTPKAPSTTPTPKQRTVTNWLTYYWILDASGLEPCSSPNGTCLPTVIVRPPAIKAFLGDLVELVNGGNTTEIKDFFENSENYEKLSIFFIDEQIEGVGDGSLTVELTVVNSDYKTFMFSNTDGPVNYASFIEGDEEE